MSMRLQHRPHFRYASPVAPAYRRRVRTGPARQTPLRAFGEGVPEPAEPARGIAVAIPVSAALWVAILYGATKLF